MAEETSMFNLIRKHRGEVSIFRRNLHHKEAVQLMRHYKNLAKNSGGHVYFEIVEVPKELRRSQLDELITDAA